jgi:hypothetical protein
MASAQQYAEWILANQDKKGTPDFETVAVAYRQLRGIAAPELPEPDFLDQIEEFGKGIPRGIIGLAEQAALGGASILTEEAEEGVRESILDTAGSAREYFAPDRGSEDTVGGKFGEAVGSFAGLGLASLIPGIGMPLAGGLAVGAGAGEARERSRAADATEGERGFATALGAVVGLSELIPIKVLGALRKDVDDSVVKQILGRVKRAGIAGGAEGAQEMAAGIAQNLIEKGVYNPEQGVFTGSGEAFGYGAGVGGLVQGLLDLALPKSRGRGDVDPEEVTEESVEETLQLGYDPSAEIIFEDGSVLRGNRETIEEAGYDFDEARQNTEFRAIAKAKQQEALAAEEARIAAIPDYPAGAVPRVPDAVVDDAITEASIIFEEQAKKKAEADKKMPMVVDQPESPDFVTTPEGETLSAQQFKNKELEDQVAAQVAALEAEIVSGDQPAPQVLQQRQLADESQAVAAAKAELAGRPQTDLFPTQLTTAEAQAARQPAPEPAPEPAQKISQKFLKDIGIAPTDTRTRKTKPIYQRLMAKKEVPLAELNAELKAYVDNPDVKDAPTKAKINEFLGVPQNKQIELAFEGTETVTPTETTETEKTAETVKEVTTSSSTTAEKSVTEEAKEDNTPAGKAAAVLAKRRAGDRAFKGRGAPTTFTTATVETEVEDALAPGTTRTLRTDEPVSEADLEQQSEQRRFVNQVSRDMQRQELDTKPLTIGERAEAVMKSPLGIEPALANVPAEYRKQVTAAVETERTIREAMAQKTADEKAVKQRKANAAVTESAKDTKTKVPELSGTAQKRPAPKRRTTLKSLPEDVVKEANKRIDQGEPGSVNEIITKVKEDLGIPRFQDGVDTPLPDSVIQQLRQGNLKEALELVSKSEVDPIIKRLAKQFSTMVGTTKVAIVPANPEDISGKDNYYELKNKQTAIAYRQVLNKLEEKNKTRITRVPGMYQPVSTDKNLKHFNDIILLDEVTGLTPATLMHEMAHAVTYATLQNPSHPLTKQITKLFKEVEPKLSGVNGTDNVLEFVAEAYGSQEFIQELSKIQVQVKGKFISALQALYNNISNFIRSKLGLAPVELSKTDAFTKLDSLLQKIIAPASDMQGAGDLLQNSTDPEVRALMRKMGNVQKDFKAPTKKFREDFINQSDKFLRSGVSGTSRRTFLGFMPSLALSDIAGSYNKKLGDLGLKLHELMEEQRGALNKKDNAADGTMKQVDQWAKNNQAAVPLLDDVITESTLEGVDPSKPRSTYEKNAAKLAIWKGLQPKWNKLKESGGQDIYVGMRDSYAKLYKELIAVINKRIDGLDVDKENKEKLRKSVFDKITDRAGTDPYFPLMRSGDYKLSFQAYNEATDSTEPVFLMFESPRERDKYVKNELENNDTVERDGEGALVYSEYDGNDSPTYKKTTSASFVNEVLEILETAKVDAAVRNQILNSFIETLPETSFAKNFQRREGVAGFDQDHIRVMRSKIYDIGRQVTRLDYTNRITKMQQQILGTDPDNLDGTLAGLKNREGTLKDIQAELEARAEFAMRPPKDGFAQSANRAAFIWTIGFNTSSALVNLSQVPLFVLPMLGGQYGFRNASKAVTEAAGLVSGTLLSSKTRSRRIRGIVPFGKNDTVDAFAMPSMDNLFEMDEAGNYTVRKDIEGYAERRKELEEILPLVQLAAERSQLNRSLFADSLGLDSSGRDKSVIDRVSSWSAFMFHQVEQYNRQVTMLTAYKLELARLNDSTKATKAEQALSTAKKRELAAQNALRKAQELNGGSVLETAPRFAQKGVGRVALMYKTYGIQMYYTMIKTAVAGLRRENDPEVRKAALRQLVAVHGSALFFAGVQGLPLFGAFTMIANLFLDEDEDDAETIVRKHIGEGWYKGALTELLDVDVSQRVALTNLLFQVNRYNRNPSPEETVFYYLGGPAWSVGKSFIRGTGELINGDMERGIEAMVPGAVRNGLKAIRYTEEGALTRRKDPILDDITGGQLVAQVIGFAPAEYARRQEENQGVKRIENTLRTNRGKLLKQYYLAMRMGDYEEARDVKQDILDFNKRVSRKFPKAIITSDSVARSMRSHMRTSATMHNGIAISPMFRTALQEHLDDSSPITLED